MTGSGPDGQMPKDPEVQFRNAFHKITTVINEAGADFGAAVEMTSYHIDISAHFDLFDRVRRDFVQEPFLAWTAVEVAGLGWEGTLVEIRAIARAP